MKNKIYAAFISYARADGPFPEELTRDLLLELKNELVWFDRNIPGGANWQEEICNGILSSCYFVFVISPNSLKSAYCHTELDIALKHNKSIIPVLYRPIDAQADGEMRSKWAQLTWTTEGDASEHYQILSAMNWVNPCTDSKGCAREILRLIHMNFERNYFHTLLMQQAEIWEKRQRKKEYLLHGNNFMEAQKNYSVYGNDAPKFTTFQTEFYHANVNARRSSEMYRNFVVALFSIVIIALISLVITSVTATIEAGEKTIRAETAEAVASNREELANSLLAVTESRRFLNPSMVIDPNLALAHALNAIGYTNHSVEAERILREAYYTPSVIGDFEFPDASNEYVVSAAISADGRYAVMGTQSGMLLNWEISGRSLRNNDLISGAGQINDIYFLPNSDQVVILTASLNVMLCHPSTIDSCEQIPFEHDVTAIAVSLQRKIAFGTENGTIYLWDIATGQITDNFFEGHPRRVNAIAFDSTGRQMISGSEGGNDPNNISNSSADPPETLLLWDVTSSQVSNSFGDYSDSVRSVAFSPNDDLVVSGAYYADNAILWDANTGERLADLGHEDTVLSVGFIDNGRKVISASEDQKIAIWDSVTGSRLYLFEQYPTSNSVGSNIDIVVSPEEDFVVIVSPSRRNVWSLRTEPILERFDQSDLEVQKVYDLEVLSSERGLYAVASFRGGHQVGVWNVSNGSRLCLLQGLVSDVRSLSALPITERSLMVVGTVDGMVGLWDVTPDQNCGQLVRYFEAVPNTFQGNAINALNVSADGRYAGAGTDSGTLVVWDIATGDYKAQMVANLQSRSIRSLAFTQVAEETHLIAASSDGTIIEWSVPDAIEVRSYAAHLGLLSMDVSGNYLLTGHADGSLWLWDVSTGAVRQQLPRPIGGAIYALELFIDSEERLYAIVTDDSQQIELWDIQLSDWVYRYSQNEVMITALGISADGSHLVTGDDSGMLISWRIDTTKTIVEEAEDTRFIPDIPLIQ